MQITSEKRTLVAAGDVGGARAILPALVKLKERHHQFDLLDHGWITREAPNSWSRTKLPDGKTNIKQRLRGAYRVYVFGTSVGDGYPLEIARLAQNEKLVVVCVLDNWMNYRRRLETDGKNMFIPDHFAVMDDLAREEAIADGISPSSIRIVGHPALSSLGEDYHANSPKNARTNLCRKNPWFDEQKPLLLFVSEPVEDDDGGDPRSPLFRGYTEKTVLKLVASALEPFHESIQVGILPHPREQTDRLLRHWENCRGRLCGGQIRTRNGREALFAADAVCGMASLLLYEAFLIQKPVASVQPGLVSSQRRVLQKLGVKPFVTDHDSAADELRAWLVREVFAPQAQPSIDFSVQLEAHTTAASQLADLVVEVAHADATQTARA